MICRAVSLSCAGPKATSRASLAPPWLRACAPSMICCASGSVSPRSRRVASWGRCSSERAVGALADQPFERGPQGAYALEAIVRLDCQRLLNPDVDRARQARPERVQTGALAFHRPPANVEHVALGGWGLPAQRTKYQDTQRIDVDPVVEDARDPSPGFG